LSIDLTGLETTISIWSPTRALQQRRRLCRQLPMPTMIHLDSIDLWDNQGKQSETGLPLINLLRAKIQVGSQTMTQLLWMSLVRRNTTTSTLPGKTA